jgi:hypothetical protein
MVAKIDAYQVRKGINGLPRSIRPQYIAKLDFGIDSEGYWCGCQILDEYRWHQ